MTLNKNHLHQLYSNFLNVTRLQIINFKSCEDTYMYKALEFSQLSIIRTYNTKSS